MVSVVARTASAAGLGRGLIVAGLLAVAGCQGTEHVVFLPIKPTVTVPPPPRMDAGTTEVDAAEPEDAAPDAADAEAGDPDEDAGPDDLDRTVTFEWKETLPGQGTCKAGQYVGSFTCVVPPDPSVPAMAFELWGQVVFTLGTSSEQQVLAVIDGGLKDPLGFETARLSGSLRCVDKQFEGQTTGAGMLWFQWSAFEATLGGQFDDQSLVIEGPFLMTNPAGARCQGTFHVSAAP
jgi:hypothetical protein